MSSKDHPEPEGRGLGASEHRVGKPQGEQTLPEPGRFRAADDRLGVREAEPRGGG